VYCVCVRVCERIRQAESMGDTITVYSHGPRWGLKSFHPQCLSLHALLRYTRIRYHTHTTHNTDMSPDGHLPVMCAVGPPPSTHGDSSKRVTFGGPEATGSSHEVVVAGIQNTFAFVRARAELASLKEAASAARIVGLDGAAQAEMSAYMALLTGPVEHAVAWTMWVNAANFAACTKDAYGDGHPWPLNHVIPAWESMTIDKEMRSDGWTEERVLEELDQALAALSVRLRDALFFYGNVASEIDALTYGYVAVLMFAPFKDRRACDVLSKYDNLLHLSRRIHEQM